MVSARGADHFFLEDAHLKQLLSEMSSFLHEHLDGETAQ